MTHLKKDELPNTPPIRPITKCGIVDYGQITYDSPESITCLVCFGRHHGLDQGAAIRLSNAKVIEE